MTKGKIYKLYEILGDRQKTLNLKRGTLTTHKKQRLKKQITKTRKKLYIQK